MLNQVNFIVSKTW